VSVISIIGDPNLHEDLVDELIDMEFERVIQLVKKGFKFSKKDWMNLYIQSDESHVERVMPSTTTREGHSTRLFDDEKLQRVINMMTLLEKKVERIEIMLEIKKDETNRKMQTKFPGAESAFKIILDAKNFLLNKKKKNAYDLKCQMFEDATHSREGPIQRCYPFSEPFVFRQDFQSTENPWFKVFEEHYNENCSTYNSEET
ncbi:unnamed protein product, partial [Cochlearia groenlandica]